MKRTQARGQRQALSAPVVRAPKLTLIRTTPAPEWAPPSPDGEDGPASDICLRIMQPIVWPIAAAGGGGMLLVLDDVIDLVCLCEFHPDAERGDNRGKAATLRGFTERFGRDAWLRLHEMQSSGVLEGLTLADKHAPYAAWMARIARD